MFTKRGCRPDDVTHVTRSVFYTGSDEIEEYDTFLLMYDVGLPNNDAIIRNITGNKNDTIELHVYFYWSTFGYSSCF